MTVTEDETRQHIHRVQHLMYKLVRILLDRCENHDKSKLEEPEKSGFEAMDAEPNYPYGSPAYYEKLERYKHIIEHHYKHNSHHPEHYAGFISEMDLLDILEMLCDWSSRRKGRTAMETIELVEQQAERFNIPSLLSSIMLNTLKRYLATEIDTIAAHEDSAGETVAAPLALEEKESKDEMQALKEQTFFQELFDHRAVDLSALSNF